MKSCVFLDIETLPTERRDVMDELRANVKPPATYKKPESIAEWMKQEGDAAFDEAHRKTALDGAFGRVCVIGWAAGSGEVRSLHSTTDERSMLVQFAVEIDRAVDFKFNTQVIGHNVLSFDLRFLLQRYIVNSVNPPFVLTRAVAAKPWETEKVYDTMIQWAGVGGRISLQRLCLALDIPSPKDGMDGSKVFDAVKEGRITEVVDYCKRDVNTVREIYKRMVFHGDGTLDF